MCGSDTKRIRINYKLKVMKKKILLLGIVAINCASFGQRIDIGIKGGVNFSKLEIPDINTSCKTGYHFGAYSLLKFGKLGIQPEFIFSQQGSKVDLGDWDAKYINIPVIVKLYLVAGFNLQAGPQFGFLNKAELDGNSIKEDLKKADVSLGLGLGWDTPIGLNIDAPYNLGMTDNSDDPAYETIKNQVFQLSLGFRIFHLGKK